MFEISQLKRQRVQLGLTQAQLAMHAKVSQSLITKIESGRIDPKYSTVQKIREAFQTLTHHKQKTVKHLMQRHILLAAVDDSIAPMIKSMQRRGISQVPVIEGKHIAGLVTEASILEAMVTGTAVGDLRARDVMVDPPPILSIATPVDAAASLLEHSPIVIVTERGIIRGIVTRSDLIKAAK